MGIQVLTINFRHSSLEILKRNRKCSFVIFLALTFLEIDAMPDREEIMNEKHIGVEDRSCIALGDYGCDGNNGACCREGNPYGGTMRNCVNVGTSSSPNYQCQEA